MSTPMRPEAGLVKGLSRPFRIVAAQEPTESEQRAVHERFVLAEKEFNSKCARFRIRCQRAAMCIARSRGRCSIVGACRQLNLDPRKAARIVAQLCDEQGIPRGHPRPMRMTEPLSVFVPRRRP